MNAGQSAGEQARRAAAAAAELRARADAVERAAARWQAGEEGERALAGHLEVLRTHGWHLLADRALPGSSGNVDMVVVGPPGAVVVDAKNWSGETSVVGTSAGWSLRVDGYRRDDALAGVRQQVDGVVAVLSAHGYGAVPVLGAVCLVGGATVPAPHDLGGVTVVSGVHVAGWLWHRPHALGPAWVDATARTLEHVLSPRVAHGVGEAVAPTEPVVFVTPWFKHGQRRMYVRDEMGNDGGHLDLRDGTAVGTSRAAEAVLRQMLPRYLDDASSELNDADRASVRRFLGGRRRSRRDEPVAMVVGDVWRRHGHWRLYVHRLAADGSSAELGFFDLHDGLAVCPDTADAAAVRWCGRRYVELEAART